MNKVILIGRLTRDPETRQTQSGISMTTFSLAVTRRFKGANGEKETDYLNIVTWRQLADLCAQYLKKGYEAAVLGSIQTRSYEDKEGVKRYVTEIVADEVEFLRRPSGEGAPVSRSAEYGPQDSDFEPIDDIKLPF